MFARRLLSSLLVAAADRIYDFQMLFSRLFYAPGNTNVEWRNKPNASVTVLSDCRR